MSDIKDILLAVSKFLEKALDAWKVFIETRQEAYNRSQDKRKRKAIDFGEKYIIHNSAFNKEDKELLKLKKLFFKFNN